MSSTNQRVSKMVSLKIIRGDCLDVLRTMPDESVHCAVTSPPFWNLRDYGVEGQIGLEKTPEEYVDKILNVFREVKRVLRSDGTLWLNIGDSYVTARGRYSTCEQSFAGGGFNDKKWGDLQYGGRRDLRGHSTLKDKDLAGIPWRVAFALQADGWWIRNDIIWSKKNVIPESMKDRCTKSHEHVFLMAKSLRYFYDAHAIKEPSANPTDNRKARAKTNHKRMPSGDVAGIRPGSKTYPMRNKRDVWFIASQPFKGDHYATFPPDLVEPCIKAGTSQYGCCPACLAPYRREAIGDLAGDDIWVESCKCDAGDPVPATVLDPFGGAGTTLMTAARLGRSALSIELNGKYCMDAKARIEADSPLFNKVEIIESKSEV